MSLSANPKQPSRVLRYNPNLQRQLQAEKAAASGSADAQEQPTDSEPTSDWMSLLSLILGVIGLMLRYKLCAWLALFAMMASIANMRKKDVDYKQIVCSVMFAVMGLVMNYFGVKQTATPGAQLSSMLPF